MFDALNWAMNDAPVRDPLERLVLESYAMKADGDGCNAFPAMSWLAERTMIDERTIKERRAELIKRGLLKLADDQSPANYIPKNRRPKVYEVMVPCSWWGKDALERINRFRATRGRAPITLESRPDLAPVERRRRSDAGKKRPQRNSGDTPVDSGGTCMPPQDSESGGTYMPPPGGTYMPPPGGTYMPPNLSLDLNQDLPTSEAPAAAADSAAGTAGSGRQEPETSTQTQTRVPNPRRRNRANHHQQPEHPAAAELVDALDWPGTIDRARITASRRNLITAAASALAAGHHPDTVRATALEAMPGAETPGSVVAALKTLAGQEPDPAIAAAAQRAAATAERERMANTPHEFVPDELTPTYCQLCGRTRNNPNAHGTRTTVDVPAPAMTGGVR